MDLNPSSPVNSGFQHYDLDVSDSIESYHGSRSKSRDRTRRSRYTSKERSRRSRDKSKDRTRRSRDKSKDRTRVSGNGSRQSNLSALFNQNQAIIGVMAAKEQRKQMASRNEAEQRRAENLSQKTFGFPLTNPQSFEAFNLSLLEEKTKSNYVSSLLFD